MILYKYLVWIFQHAFMASVIQIIAITAQAPSSGSPGPLVRISEDALQASRVKALDRVSWTAPRSDAVYCVSEGPPDAVRLSFWCADCPVPADTNPSAGYIQPLATARPGADLQSEIARKTQDLSTAAGFPVIKLDDLELLDGRAANGVTLACNATYTDPRKGTSSAAVVTVPVSVQYISKPRIVNGNGLGPACSPAGGCAFWVEPPTSNAQVDPSEAEPGRVLHCAIDANPPVARYLWTANGVQVSAAPSLAVTRELMEQTIVCSGFSETGNGKQETSDQVRLATLIPPQVRLIPSSRGNRSETTGRLVEQARIGSRLELKCTARGHPTPQLIWYHARGDSRVVNASCRGGSSGVVTPQIPSGDLAQLTAEEEARLGVTAMASGLDRPKRLRRKPVIKPVVLQSSCTIDVSDLTTGGAYWCAACNLVAQDYMVCEPDLSQGPQQLFEVDVRGKPYMLDFIYKQPERTSDPDAPRPLAVPMRFCANPPPTKLQWIVDGEVLRPGERTDNIMAHKPQLNASFTQCYQMVLELDPVSPKDHRRSIRLVVENSIGVLEEVLDLNAIRGKDYGDPEADFLSLAIGVAVALLIVFLLVMLIVCWSRRCACFSGAATKPNKSNQPKYLSNVRPDGKQAENGKVGNGKSHGENGQLPGPDITDSNNNTNGNIQGNNGAYTNYNNSNGNNHVSIATNPLAASNISNASLNSFDMNSTIPVEDPGATHPMGYGAPGGLNASEISYGGSSMAPSGQSHTSGPTAYVSKEVAV